MTKQKNTKRALLASVLSMMLCMAMLVGSTFAWFADSVTSGRNKIVAGNLDVELEYLDADNQWQTVTADTKLFSDFEADGKTQNLWEPGHTEVVYLKISNVGSLALKYQFTVTGSNETLFTNALGKENCKLSDYLVFGQVESAEEIAKYATREEAWAAAGDTLGLNNYAKTNDLLKAGEAEYVALVVYMPTTVGNEANYRGNVIPSIDLGINLVATQTPFECDSFNDQYDLNVEYPYVTTLGQLNSTLTKDDIPLSDGSTTKHVPVEITMGDVQAADVNYSEHSSGYTGKGVLLGSTNLNYYAAKPADAGDYTFIFKDGTITSGATSYTNVDNCEDTAVYMLLPGNSDVVFENMTFNGAISFGVQMYTSPWSYLNSITFKNCTFNAVVVGSCPAVHATFDGCIFNNYDNGNNSNPIWWRSATGYWGAGFEASVHSLETFTFINNRVTSTRPVKIERIGQGVEEIGYTPKITIMNNRFDISRQSTDDVTKNMAINIGQMNNKSKFILIDDGNTISDNTASLYTASLSGGSNQYIEVSGTQILDGNGDAKEITAMVWKTKTGETFIMKSIE